MAIRPHTPRRSWLRRIALGAALLVLGLMISVGAAWGSVRWTSFDSGQGSFFTRISNGRNWKAHGATSDTTLTASELADLNKLIDALRALPDAEWQAVFSCMQPLNHYAHVKTQWTTSRSYEELVTAVLSRPGQSAAVRRDRAGWPWWCAESTRYSSSQQELSSSDSSGEMRELPDWVGKGNYLPLPGTTAPWHILWPGLILNSLIYASIVWLSIFGLGFIRRARRRAKGRCATCGYSLAGLAPGAPCAECGRPSASPRAPSPSPPR